jgi:hypothetical protein
VNRSLERGRSECFHETAGWTELAPFLGVFRGG